MPFEIMVIIIVAIVAGTLGGISKQFLAYLQNRQSSGRGESTLTTSGLQKIVQESVERANQPLLEKIERLEKRLNAAESRRLPAHEETERTDLLDRGLLASSDEPEPAPRSTRTRA